MTITKKSIEEFHRRFNTRMQDLSSEAKTAFGADPERIELQWSQEPSWLSSCAYNLRDPYGISFGSISIRPSSPSRDSRLEFHTTYVGVNGWLKGEVFSHVDEAKFHVKNNVHPAYTVGPFPSLPSYPLWLRDEWFSHLFASCGTCIGYVTERHVIGGDPFFLAEIGLAKIGLNEWTQLGYLKDREDAEHLVITKLEQRHNTQPF